MTYLTLRNNDRVAYRRDLDRLFGDFWALPSQQTNSWAPAADIDEEEGHYDLSVEAAGLKRE
ncbi:hypothetical protein ABTE74_20600, partial [Acinetobacter baumannii]